MIGKNNLIKRYERQAEKVERYSIKKFKAGAASVLIGVGLFFGAGVVEASDNATEQLNGDKKVSDSTETSVPLSSAVEAKPAEKKVENTREKVAEAVAEKLNPQTSEKAQAAEKTQQVADKTLLLQKIEELKAQLERIKNNSKQQSMINDATNKLALAEALIQTSVNQKEVDAKTKEISSLTSILKSIKAEETPKENKNQDSRNGKKMEEGTGFRTGGVTDQALTGSIHFDTSKGPTEKKIPVSNNGDGERVINMAITYSASSNDTVTDGKVRVTIPKAFLHSTKKPVFTNSSFVKSMDDRSTDTEYIYDLNLNPMSGGSVAESLLKLYVGTSRTNAPSKDDSLPVKTEFISGGNVLSTKTATATFDYLSEIIYRENDTREKLVKNYLPQEQREYKIGSVVDGKLVPVSSPFRIPLIMTNDPFFNNGEADGNNQNGNGRLTSYDYTISGIPEFLELDPTSPKNSKWTLENGVATLHPDQKAGINQMLYYAGPVLRLKEGALSTPEEIAKVIESNGTKGYSAKIVYKAVGHRPDGSSFTQTLENPDGFRIYAGDGAPSIGMMEDRINAATNQRLFSNASNVDTFGTVYRVPLNNLKTDGGTLPSQYLSYLIPKDQEGNYFTKFKITQIFTNESENGSSWVRGYHSGYKDVRSQFKENFQLYGVNENNQAELIKDYTTIDELFNETTINSDKRYQHLILKTPGIVDEIQDKGQADKTILGLTSDLDVTVGTWKEKAKDPTITRYENKISQVLAASNTIESAIATERPNTGSSTPAVHTKEPTTLSLGMQQIGDQELTKDNLTRGKNIPIAVQYTATDYFKLAESEKNGIKVYDLDKLDSNINKTSVMLLADPKVPLKDFRLTADNRLLSKNTLYFGGTNGSAAKDAYNQIKESYDTVNPTRIIENYKGTGKRAYIFESKDLGISSYDLNRDGWIKGGTYNPVALTFEVENNGQIESGTYNIESYLVWNSNSETLFGNDRSLNANYVEGHEPGATIAKSNINVTMNNVIEYSTSLTISKPGSTGTRGIIDVKNGQEVILTPRVENLTDTPQKIKEAVVLIPKSEAVTYLEGPIAENSDEYDIVYTTSTAADKTTGTYVTADQITNWKDVTAVKYVFKNDYTVTKEHGFTHNFNLRVDADNPNFVQSTSQIFLKNGQNLWLESNTVGLRTEDVRGKLEVRYINARKDDILPKITEKEFAGQPYTTTKEDVIPRGTWSGLPYLFKEIQADSAPETGTYERQVTKKVTYIYEEATFEEESKTITRTINYLEKNNESNVVANPVVQNITVKRKIYTGKETGRVVKGPWEYRTDDYQPNWPTTNSPKVANFEAPDREVIDRVLVSQELVNNGNVVENVYYERIMPIGGDVVAKYVIEGTTTELKPSTDVAKGLKVGKEYTSTAPAAGEELTATDGKVYVYKGHKATSAGEQGTVTADKQEVVYEYAPKIGGDVEVKYVIAGTEENLKVPVTLVTGGQVGSDYTATKDATITKEDGRVYKLVAANNGLKTGSAGETGKVTTEKQTVTYEYELQKGNVTVTYKDTEGNKIPGYETPKNVETQSPTGKEYTTVTEALKPTKITTPDGKVYNLVPTRTEGNESGKVTEGTQNVTYVYKLAKGDVTVSYRDTEGNKIPGYETPKDAEKDAPTGKEFNTATGVLKPAKITAPSGKVYNLVPTRTEGNESGKVTETPQNVTYVYELAKGDVTVSYKDTEGSKIEGYETPKEAEKAAPTGKDFNTATEVLKPVKITTPTGKVYNLVPTRTEGNESGKVTETPQNVTYVYELVKGNVTVTYKDTEGNTIEGYETPKDAEKAAPTGKDFNTATPELKPAKITTPSGKVYNLVPTRTEGAESGKVTEIPQNVTYVYELAKGNVTVSYKDTEGNKIPGYETPKDVEKDAPTGKDFNTATEALKPVKITTPSGKVYNLVPTRTEGSETGKVTEAPQNVTYVYELAKGDVTVKYETETGETIKPDNNLKSKVPTGEEYNTTIVKDLTITKDGKVYKLVETNGGIKDGSSNETGKVTETPAVVTYVYSEVKGEIIQKFVNESGKEIKDPTNTGKKSLNEKVSLKYPNRITDKDGKVYEFVKVDKVPTKFTEQPQTVTYTYRAVKGQGVTVSYETTTGVTLKETQTVMPKDSQLGTDYDTTTSTLKPERIEKNGKVYLLQEKTKVGSAEEKGKVTEQPQNVTYVYEEVTEPESKQKYGNVIVTYVDKFGHPLSGLTEKGVEVNKSVIDTPASLVKTPYDTTDNKPETITTKDGKVYKLIKLAKTSDAENSDVKGRTSVITYIYELLNSTEVLPETHIGFVVVNYVDENGLPIFGKDSIGKEVPTTVIDVNGELVGEKYDTRDHKPATIITANGDVYEFVKVSDTQNAESGELKEGVTTVEYIYRKVNTSYVDEKGKEINPSDKGTKDKKEIPEYIYKETKKGPKGNTIHIYRQVTTTYVDEKGKEINPSDKGTKDKKEIPEYIYKETKKDKEGNTIHIYRKNVPSTPSINNNKTTIWKDESGKVLKPEEKGTKDKGKISGYEYVRTIVDKDGNTVHIFRKVTVITPIETSKQKEENKTVNKVQTKRLANTGTTQQNTGLAGLGLALLSATLVAIKRRKR